MAGNRRAIAGRIDSYGRCSIATASRPARTPGIGLACRARPDRHARSGANPNLPMSDVIKWGSLRGWFDKDKGDLVLTDQGRRAFEQPDADERALELAVARGGTLFSR